MDDDTKSHVCEESEDCRPHTYARVSYEAECRIPPFVNLIQTIGGRREVRRCSNDILTLIRAILTPF